MQEILDFHRELPENQDPLKLLAIEEAGQILKEGGVTLLRLPELALLVYLLENHPETGEPEIRQFTADQTRLLNKQGFLTDYSLTEQTCDMGDPDLEAVPTRKSAVAFKPADLFIPGSNNQTRERQLEILDKYNKRLQKKVPGVKAILLLVDQIKGIDSDYLERTGGHLFGQANGQGYTITQTSVDSEFAIVGNSDPQHGLRDGVQAPEGHFDGLFLACFIMPM